MNHLLSIPPHVTRICKNAFYDCELEHIEFAENSEIQIIENKTFRVNTIDFIEIPSSIIELQNGWCIDRSQ